jgi:hypothetical protein
MSAWLVNNDVVVDVERASRRERAYRRCGPGNRGGVARAPCPVRAPSRARRYPFRVCRSELDTRSQEQSLARNPTPSESTSTVNLALCILPYLYRLKGRLWTLRLSRGRPLWLLGRRDSTTRRAKRKR